MPFTPNVITCSSFWNPTARNNGADTGLNGAPPLTASAILRGSGYPEKCVLQHSARYIPCFESDADTISDYIMIWLTGDPTKIGNRQIEVNFEGTTATFNTVDHVQWDPVKKRYGIPLALRPFPGRNGVARCRIKSLQDNGYERVMSFDVWFNYPGATNYYDRHANAIYVSGDDLNGSGAAGTNDATVGTSGNPNFRLNRAFQFAGTTREGCFIYVKGSVKDDTNGAGNPTGNILPCEIRPWPGMARNQCRWGQSSRLANNTTTPNIWKLLFRGIQIDSNSIVRIQGAAGTRGGFIDCEMLGVIDGGVDIYGQDKGLFSGLGGVNSQNFVTATNGEIWTMEDCVGALYCCVGFRVISNCPIQYGWDAIFLTQAPAGEGHDRGFWFSGYNVYGPKLAHARFHSLDDLVVTGVTYDSVNRWTRIAVDPTGQNIQNNIFETAVKFLTGSLAGTGNNPPNESGWNFYQVFGASAAYASGLDNTCAIAGATPPSGFPNANTVYIKGNNLSGSIAIGDRLRVYNFPHKDAFQTSMQRDNQPCSENGYLQNYKNVALDPQGMLLQSNIRVSTLSGATVSVSANSATFSASQTWLAGQSLEIKTAQGVPTGEYALFTTSGTGTVAPLDRASLNGKVGARFGITFTIVGEGGTFNNGEATVVGNVVTTSTPVKVMAGHSFQLLSGPNRYKYAIINEDATNVTTFTLDRTDLDGSVGIWARALPIKDFVFENYICHRYAEGPYLFQWEAVGLNMHFINATLIEQASNDLYMVIKNQTPGFGARNCSFTDCIIGRAVYSTLVGPHYAPDIVFRGNHFIDNNLPSEVPDATKTSGPITFDSSGTANANYFPSGATLGTVETVFVPFDANGNARSIGDKVGAVAKVGAAPPITPNNIRRRRLRMLQEQGAFY